MSNKFNFKEELQGYRNWLLDNKKAVAVTVGSTTVVVTLVAGLVAVPLNNAKNTAQTEYDKIMTKYRASLVVNTDLEQLVATLKGTISNLVDERDGLKLQLQQAEEPAEEEIIEEAEEEQ